eukprot:3971895-Pyramimonas_sp.AAC.1
MCLCAEHCFGPELCRGKAEPAGRCPVLSSEEQYLMILIRSRISRISERSLRTPQTITARYAGVPRAHPETIIS